MNGLVALLLLALTSTPPPNPSALMAEASAQLVRGDYGSAVVTLEKAIAAFQKLNEPTEEAKAWGRLGQTYAAIGAYRDAASAFEKGAALAGTSNSPPTRAIIDMLDASDKAAQWGPSTAFLRSFDNKLELLPGGRLWFDHFWPFLHTLTMMTANPSVLTGSIANDTLTSAPMLTDMMVEMSARDLLGAGDLAGARKLWMAALTTSTNSDLRSGHMAGIGATYLKEGKTAEAIRWLEQAADAQGDSLRGIRLPALMSTYVGSERRWYYDITIETLLRDGRAEEALDYSERSRARAFLQMMGTRRPTSGPLSTIEPLHLAEVRKALPAATTLIVYFVSAYGVRAWVIDEASIHSEALPFDRPSLERTVAWATSFRSPDARGVMPVDARPPRALGTAEEAFRLLIEPLRRHIRHRRLIIVPHGELHYVPFAALRDARSGRYLVEDYTVALAPSASTLRYLRANETPVDGGTLVLGNPLGGRLSLPGSAREATAVARTFGTTPLLGSSATADRLYLLGGRFDLLHIAAHARYDARDPSASFLALAPSATHGGRLDVVEILSKVDLGGVNLAVLSACETAAGKSGGGDDMVSLTRAILYAGAPGVISTL